MGSTEIARRDDFEGEHLGAWVSTQCKRYLKGEMSEERMVLLEQIGCKWNVQ